MAFRSFDSWYEQAKASIDAVDYHNKVFSYFLEYVTELKEDLDNSNKEIERLQDENYELVVKIEKLEENRDEG